MAVSSTIDFTVNYDLDIDSLTYRKFVIEDTTPYVAEGIALADVAGYFRIDFPDGSFYQGSASPPDISPATSLVFNTVDIPLSSQNYILKGDYTFLYTIIVTGATQPGTYTKSQTNELCPVFDIHKSAPPKPTVSYTQDCRCLILTGSDDTNYGVPTTQDYVFELYGPVSVYGSTPVETSVSTDITYTFQYTGGYSFAVNSLLTYVDGNFTVTIRVKGEKAIIVNCDIDLCRLYNCIKDLDSRYLNEVSIRGGVSYVDNSLSTKVAVVHLLQSSLNQSLACGKYADANSAYDQISKMLNCNCSCDDDDDTPRLIYGSCSGSGSGSGGHNTVSAGTGITVTSSVVGDHTNYSISLNTAYQNAITQNAGNIGVNTLAIAALQASVTGIVSSKYQMIRNWSNEPFYSIDDTSFVTLGSVTVPAATLTQHEDKITYKAVLFTGESASSYNVSVQLVFNGAAVETFTYNSSNDTVAIIEVDVYYSGRIYAKFSYPNGITLGKRYYGSAPNWTGAVNIGLNGMLHSAPTGLQSLAVENMELQAFKL